MRILFVVLLLGGCASQDPWTTGDTVWQGIYIATLLADGYMTTKVQDHPNIIENGPIASAFLGHNPSTSDVVWYITSAGVFHYIVARALPRGWRTFWQVGGIWRHGQGVNHGHQLGVFGEPCTRHQEEHPC